MRQTGTASCIIFGSASPFGQLTVHNLRDHMHNGIVIDKLSVIVCGDTLIYSVFQINDAPPQVYTYHGNFTVKWLEVTLE